MSVSRYTIAIINNKINFFIYDCLFEETEILSTKLIISTVGILSLLSGIDHHHRKVIEIIPE